MRKFTKLFSVTLVALIVLAGFSCKKNNVKKIEVDNSFALSIFKEDSITMNMMLDALDSTWRNKIHVNDDGTMYIVFCSDTVRNVLTGEEVLSNVDPVSFEYHDFVEVPELNVPDTLMAIRDLLVNVPQSMIPEFEFPFNFDTTVNIGHVATVPLEFENFSIIEAFLKTGMLNMGIDLGMDSGIHAVAYIQSENIRRGDENFNIEINIPGDSRIDLSGWNMSPSNDSVSFSAWFRLYLDERTIDKYTPVSEIDAIIDDIINASGLKEIEIDGELTDVNLGYLYGAVEVPDEKFSGKLDSLNLNVQAIQGDMSLKTPKVHLKYTNTFGLDMNVAIDSMFFQNSNGEYVELLGISPLEFTVTTTGEEETQDVDISPFIVPYLDILQNLEVFNYVGKASIIGDDGSYVTDESYVNVSAEFEMPLNMRINEMIYIDTFAFSFGGGGSIDINNYLDEIEFKFNVDNGFPLSMAIQLYTCDSTQIDDPQLFITDSLFKADAQGIMHNVICSNYDGTVNESVLYVTASGETVNNVLKANKLILRMSVTTEGKDVYIRSTDLLGISVGIKTKTTEINL